MFITPIDNSIFMVGLAVAGIPDARVVGDGGEEMEVCGGGVGGGEQGEEGVRLEVRREG